MNFSKAFLSHSSEDKTLVRKVGKLLNSSRREFDEETFDGGNRNSEEIFNSLSRSNLFVFFASSNSIESSWVKTELNIAQELVFSGKLGKVVIFIIDDLDYKKLPHWLNQFVFIKSSSPSRIANKIRGELTSLDLKNRKQKTMFIGRHKEKSDIEEVLCNLSTPTTNSIYISGSEGIGRRSLLIQVLKNTYPGYDINGVEINLADHEGILELLYKLYVTIKHPSPSLLEEQLIQFQEMEIEDQISNIGNIINEIINEKQFLWLHLDANILMDNGEFQPWLVNIIKKIPTLSCPQIIFVGRRHPSYNTQKKNKNIAFFKVNSLSQEDSKKLWVFALKHSDIEIDVSDQLIKELTDQISGHPGAILTTAEYIKQIGHATIKASQYTLTSEIKKLSYSLIDNISFSSHEEKLLALFDEFKILLANDIPLLFQGNDEELSKSIIKLLEFGIIESQNEFIELAPYLINAQLKQRFSKETLEFIPEARKNLLNFSRDYNIDETISIATIEATTIAAINEGKTGFLSNRSLLGSHFLKVARNYYDRSNYCETIKFCIQAYAKKETLTDNAKAEVLRLMGMSSIRTSDEESLEFSLNNLENLNSSSAKRHIYFMNGYNKRWHGDFIEAEKYFQQALELQPNDFHILRELASTLLEMERFNDAENFARNAFSNSHYTQRNPYLLDIFLMALIECRKSNISALKEDAEVENLFERLLVADKKENKHFYSARRAHFYNSLNMSEEALKNSNKAVDENPSLISAYLMRIQIKIKLKKDLGIFSSIGEDFDKIERLMEGDKARKRFVSSVNKIKIHHYLAKQEYKKAINILDNSGFLLKHLKPTLSKLIATEILYSNKQDQSLKDWANSKLSTSEQNF